MQVNQGYFSGGCHGKGSQGSDKSQDAVMFIDDKKNKRYCFKVHARKRLLERYGIVMTEAEWSEFKSKTSEAKFIKKYTDSRVVRALPFKGETLIFVWDRAIGEIVTFIPKDSWEARKILDKSGEK